MRRPGAILCCGFALLSSLNAYAQADYGTAPVPPPPGSYSAAPPPVAGYGGPAPQLFASLSDEPSTHTGFVFDHNMLQVAQGVLAANGMDEKRASAALTGIQFDAYHYHNPAFYSPEAMGALEAGYKAAGWKHLMDANQKAGNSAQPQRMITDLWLHFSGADINQVTVLTRSAREMNVVQINGDLRPLDLVHLSGHFGIPKVDPGAVMVPAPN